MLKVGIGGIYTSLEQQIQVGLQQACYAQLNFRLDRSLEMRYRPTNRREAKWDGQLCFGYFVANGATLVISTFMYPRVSVFKSGQLSRDDKLSRLVGKLAWSNIWKHFI